MLSIEEKSHFLRDVSAFESLSEEQIKVLAGICEDLTFEAGSQIFKQGDVGASLYIVVDGLVGIEREVTDETDTVSLTMVKPHQYFGEMSLFYDAPRSITTTAIKDTMTLRIRREAFVDFARQYPDLLIELNQVLRQRLVEAYDKISEVTRNRKPRELRKLYDKLDF